MLPSIIVKVVVDAHIIDTLEAVELAFVIFNHDVAHLLES